MSTDLLHEGFRVGQAAGIDTTLVLAGRPLAAPQHRQPGPVRRQAARKFGRKTGHVFARAAATRRPAGCAV